MTAKEYLLGIRQKDGRLKNKYEELQSRRSLLYSVAAVIPKERVDGGQPVGLEEKVAAKVALECEIEREAQELDEFIHKVINEIHSVDNWLFEQILFKKYVEFKSLEMIAVELNYSYVHIVRAHGYALLEFERKVMKNV